MSAFFAPEYTYIAVLGVICGFIFAFGIGANDCANAFGSSVAAKSLTTGQAVLAGCLCETAGAVLLGSRVTGTIRGKIIKTEYYEDDPEIFMFGSLSALMVGMIWLLIATANEFPVSTTHDIVAAYLGFTIAANGFESVDWKVTNLIFVSWAASPLFAGTIAGIFFLCVKHFVLKHENTFERAIHVYPIVVFVAITANLFFIMYKSGKNKVSNFTEWEYGHYIVLPVSLGGGLLCAVVTWLFLLPVIRKRIETAFAGRETMHESVDNEELGASKFDKGVSASRVAIESDSEDEGNQSEFDVDAPMPPPKAAKKSMTNSTKAVDFHQSVTLKEAPVEDAKPVYDHPNAAVNLFNRFAAATWRQDLHGMSMEESTRAADIWENTFEYDAKSESLFSYLQVFTACLASFAHGSNDTANAIAPVAGILQIYKDGEFISKADVPLGILFMGGLGISCGFLFYGYKIIKSVGFKLTHLSPAKGFCVELGAALAVSLASFLQIPVSTTQCLVGATCGVGLAHGGVSAVDWWYLARTVCGWVGIFFVVALVNAGFFSFVVFAPKL